MNNVQRQRELAERIADDERQAAAARKAADYDALVARLEVLKVAFDNSHKLNEQLGDENRALLARAEAAEAEAARLRDENAEAWHAFDRQQSRSDRLAARVAELEAAQGWRPVTEDWPEYHERVLIGHGGGYDGGWYAVARRTRTDDKDIWVMDDDTVLAFESASVAMIVPPLPPAEATE